MANLLNADLALQQILEQIQPLAMEVVPLSASLNRVLAEDIQATLDLPPFANSSMDGYAVRAVDVASASKAHPVQLQVVMDILAGSTPDGVIGMGEAARIMTGAPLPAGADTVVPVENTDADWQQAIPTVIAISTCPKSGAYIRPVGEDIRRGETVLQAGTIIRPQEIGVLAGLGCSQVPVIRQPRITILATGDELVGVDQPLSPGKIRDTNSYTLAALITDYGGLPIPLPPATDSLEAVRTLFHDALAQKPDMIISSAGVSVGAADLIRTVLDELGEVNLWRINLRPGKPLTFGHLQGIPFFGLPGNPVSAMVTFDVIVRPSLLKLAGKPIDTPTTTAIVGEVIPSDGRRTYARVKLTPVDGQLIAHITGTQSSGALMSMVLADGLLIIPEGMTEVSEGTPLPVRLLRPVQNL